MAQVDIQIASKLPLPSADAMQCWISTAVPEDKIISLRIVDSEEIQQLNRDYRQKDKPTNVLAFPCELPEEVDEPLIGDIVACAEVIANEAREQNKSLEAHWAHMLIHGSLHLLGYDHIEEHEALDMEAQETRLLAELGFPAPYEQQET